MCTSLTGNDPPQHRASKLARLVDPNDGQLIDIALLLWFSGPRSATGEDVLEIHHHGGPAVRDQLLHTLSRLPGLRLAEPGEFSKRGFFAGKLDLTELEGLADLIDARTRDQAKQAARQLDGELGHLYGDWQDRLTDCLAGIEAEIDFGDEEGDVSAEANSDVRTALQTLALEIARHLDDDRRGERLRDGLSIVISGPPNAGKSSLLNLLAKREAAIVAPVPGTTRDTISVELEIAGVPVTLTDTAGIRSSTDDIEREGIRRARDKIRHADLVLALEAVDVILPQSDFSSAGVDSIRVINKIDLGKYSDDAPAFAISCVTGQGIDTLWNELKTRCQTLAGYRSDESLAITNARHRSHLTEALHALQRLGHENFWLDHSIAGEEIRTAAKAMAKISGRLTVDNVLDRIFSRFCIGK